MNIIKKGLTRGTNIRIWVKTRAKLKAIAKYYQMPMTGLLDQICNNILKVNDDIPFNRGDSNDELS